MTDSENGTIVNVTSNGEAKIPEDIRDKLHIDTPGRVRFIEVGGEIVVRPVKRPSEIRGALAAQETDGDTSATTMLQEERKRDSDG